MILYLSTMPEIHLDEWATKVGVPQRTAQRWAKKKLIPAKRKKIAKQVIKTWHGYVIDDQTPLPE